MDKRVEIHGTSRADMNGKRGVATDFHSYPADRTKDRYSVQLDSGEAFKVKPANVRAEGAGGGAAADARGRCGQDGRRSGPSQRRLRRFRRDSERDTKHSRRRFRWTLGFALGEDLDCRAARRLCQHFVRLRVGVRSRSCQQRQTGLVLLQEHRLMRVPQYSGRRVTLV